MGELPHSPAFRREALGALDHVCDHPTDRDALTDAIGGYLDASPCEHPAALALGVLVWIDSLAFAVAPGGLSVAADSPEPRVVATCRIAAELVRLSRTDISGFTERWDSLDPDIQLEVAAVVLWWASTAVARVGEVLSAAP